MSDTNEQGTSGAGQGISNQPAIEIFVNNVAFFTEDRRLSGSQIKALAGLPADYELFLVRGSNSDPVADGEVVQLHPNQHFRAIPIGNFGSC